MRLRGAELKRGKADAQSVRGDADTQSKRKQDFFNSLLEHFTSVRECCSSLAVEAGISTSIADRTQ